MAKTQYDPEFKAQAVRLVVELHKPARQVAHELGVPEQTLHGWIKAVQQDPARPFVGSGRLRPEDQALRDLHKRIRDLEEENAILKKAMRIFTNDRK